MFSIKRVLGSSRYVLFFIVFIVLISNNLKISTFFLCFFVLHKSEKQNVLLCFTVLVFLLHFFFFC